MSGAARASSRDGGETTAGSDLSERCDTNRIMRRPTSQRNPKRASRKRQAKA